jgi:AcrR family transcriptional regulator
MAVNRSGEPGMPPRRSHGSEAYLSDLQRGRLLSATFALVGEGGYEAVSARSISERAGMSNRTFYECFNDREDCFLAAFNYALEGLGSEARAGWESQLGWTARVRAALLALLTTLDREPAVRRLVFVEALAAGPRVLACRARVLEQLAGVIDEGRTNAKTRGRLPGLVAEGVVGGAFGVIHARLLELRPEPLVGLLGQLMAMIVLPYRGSAAAARELELPIPRPQARRRDEDGTARRPLGGSSPVDYRLTARARMALAAVAGRPGLNNREVSEVIGLSDQGQVSRMMKRLTVQGLVENSQTHSKRLVRAWRLTANGEAAIDAHRGEERGRAPSSTEAQESKRSRLSTESGRRGKHRKIATADVELVDTPFRLTALTHEVLVVVASLSERGSNPSNREIAHAAKVKDEGQVSKLLARLEGRGMLENVGGPSKGANAWQLTHRGEEIVHTSHVKESKR